MKTNSIKKYRMFILGLFLSVLILTPLYAEEKTVEAEGFSDISKNDAVRQAMREAVEQGMGVFIQSETEVQNYILKKDSLLTRSQGYVTRYDIKEYTEENGEHAVKIVATVSLDKIKDDLIAMKILLESMERPKIMILVNENYSGMDNINMRMAETELNSMMGAKGFDLVDKAQVEQIRQNDQARQALAGNAAAATALGLKFGAQYIIVGTAVAQDVGEAYPESGLRSIQANVQLKIIQTQTGIVLGSVVKNGVAAHISSLTGSSKAIKQAAKSAVDEYLVDTITNSFQDFLNNGAPLKLHVAGVKSFRQYKDITAGVETVEQIVSAKKEGWNKAGGILVLDLRFKGTSDELAELLDGRNLNGNTLEVVDLAPERVDTQVK